MPRHSRERLPIRFARFAAVVSLLGAVLAPTAMVAAPATRVSFIKVDQFGYLTNMRKIAVVADPQSGFNAAESFTPGVGPTDYEVRRWIDDGVVLTGGLQPWKSGATHGQSGDRGWSFDFSRLTAAGSYYIWDKVKGVGSGRFEIGPNVYDGVLRQAMRTFYYQRLDFAKVAPYAESNWTDAAAYTGAGQDRYARSRFAKSDASTARDLRGGWMDAGDTNKYTTFAQSAVIQLIDAYRMNPAVFGDNFGIPESGNGLSDLLDEVKWELEFLKRMQNATGTKGLLLKLGVDTYDGDVTPPSSDTRPRYYLPECTSATIAGSAMFAAAGVVYRAIPSQASYGTDLITRAEAAWSRARTTTSNFTSFQTACDDGDIKSGNADDDADGQIGRALEAAVALYEATGKAEYKTFVESNYNWVPPVSFSWWGPYGSTTQVALLRFAGLAGVTAAVANAIKTQKANQNGVFSITDYQAGTDLYRAYLADAQFHWGHNQVRANTGNLNLDFVTFNINPAHALTYREVAEQHLHWLHGVNPLSMAMLSNMGAHGAESSANEIYHTWFQDGSAWDNAETSTKGPAPGYVTGGPNKDYTGTLAWIRSQPPQKAYQDWNTSWPENSWEITEPAIYSQAAYVQLLARLMTAGAGDTQPPTAPAGLAVSNVTQSGASLTWTAATDNVGVAGYDLYNGATLLVGNLVGTSTTLSGLTCGTTYQLTLKARDAAGNTSAPSNAVSMTTRACSTTTIIAYADALGAGWDDWSWGSTRNFANSKPVKVGTRSVRVDYQAWGGLSLRHTNGVAVSSSSTLRFWAYSPVNTNLIVAVQTEDGNAWPATRTVALPAKVWTDVIVTHAQMGSPSLIKRLNVQLNGTQPTTVYFDQIRITR
jgi:endoglucanase